jgi:uncharacterized lipoprotein NlpE involved in copper resistance
MKKFFTALAIFALVLAGCDDGDTPDDGNENKGTTLRIKNESYKIISNVVWQSIPFYHENADVIGIWKGSNSATLTLNSNSWTFSYSTGGSGSYSSQGTWTRSGNTLTLKETNGRNHMAMISNETLTLSYDHSLNSIPSFRTFILSSDDIDKSIKSGNNVIKTVNPGSGFIFFDVNNTSYCTKDLVVVERNENAEFNFNNNTLIVDTNDTNNTLTLGGL